MKRILVPFDGSRHAVRAIDAALELAKSNGSELRLVTVAERQRITEAVWWETYMGNLRAELEKARVEIAQGEAPVPETSAGLVEGEVVDAILTEARRWKADLIVMGTHGLGGLARAWLGSVADALVAETDVPVMLVRPDDNGLDQKLDFAPRLVAVTLDGSAFAEEALGPAIDLAGSFGSTLLLIHVVSYPAQVSTYLPDTVIDNTHFVEEGVEAGNAYLAGIEERLEVTGQQVETKVVVSPRPAIGVLDAAAEAGADLVVTASHRRRGPARWLLGGVADKIIRGGHTPVVVVPGRE